MVLKNVKQLNQKLAIWKGIHTNLRRYFGSAGTWKRGAVTQNGWKWGTGGSKRGTGGRNGVLVVREGVLGVETCGWGFEKEWWWVERHGEGLKHVLGLRKGLKGGAGGSRRLPRARKGLLV